MSAVGSSPCDTFLAMAGGDVNDDGSLAEDMMSVESLLGHKVIQMVTDNLILDLLRTYSSDRNRVQKVVRELQRTYHKEDFAMCSDEDDSELLALESPFLIPQGTLDDPINSIPRSITPVATTTSGGKITSTLSRNIGGGNPVIIREEPVLQPAKLNISTAMRGRCHAAGSPGKCTSSILSASLNEPIVGPFASHRKGEPVKTSDESSSTSTEEDSELEVVSIHEEDRKRKKSCGKKSPGKKTRVEIVDLVNSSPRSALNYEDYLGILEAMFPDADPIFLMQKFQHVENEQELNVVASALLESNNYPRMGAGAINVGGKRESTMNVSSNSSVIIKPSAFEVPRTSEPQPSTSSSVPLSNKNCVIIEPERELEEDLSLDDILSAIGAAEDISWPQSGDAVPDMSKSSVAVKYPSALVSDKSADTSQLLAPTSSEVNIQESVSSAKPGVPKQEVVECVPTLAQNAPIPKTLQQDMPTRSAVSPKSENILSTSEPLSFPSSHVKNTPLSPSSTVQNNGVIHSVDEPGPSHTNEEPWVEKYFTLLSLFPKSDPKFLESKAKLLHDNDIDFNLFVETTLEEIQNPPNNHQNDILGRPANPPEFVNLDVEAPRIGNVPLSDSAVHPDQRNSGTSVQTKSVITKGDVPRPNAPEPSSASVPLPAATSARGPNASEPAGADVLLPSATIERRPNAPEPRSANAPLPAATSVRGPSCVNIPRPKANSVAGPSSTHIPKPCASNVAGPSGLNNSGSSSVDDDDCKGNPWCDKYSFLLSILPDADPTFLEEKAKALYDKDEDMKTFVANALENKDYPTLKDYQRRQEIIALQNKYLNDFNIENFLDIVPEPFKYFSQSNRKPSLDSRERGLLFLKRKYRKIRSNDITAAYKKHQYNLTNTCHELDSFRGLPLKSRRPDFVIADKIPDINISLQFLQEVAFIENENKIKKYLEDKEAEEERALKEAREKGELLECQCCFDDEVLSRNIVTCPEGHIFCKSCVRKGAETKIGEGETVLLCLTDCQSEFTLQSLQGVLKPTVFSKLAQRKQLEEIKAAGIEDLVQCPFCDFCNIPGTGDKIFRCLNPDCMKDSCIMCKEESHIPLRCDEVEKASEVKMRTYIEDKMTEALVRTCWKCQRKFVKIDGCNKMTCQCGALMCYVCRQPVKDYSHFNGQGGDDFHKCPLFSDNNALHVDAVERVAAEAKAELAQKHPGLALKHDPTSVPIQREAGGRRPGPAFHLVPLRIENLFWDQQGHHVAPQLLGANRLPPPIAPPAFHIPPAQQVAPPLVAPPPVAPPLVAQAARIELNFAYAAAELGFRGDPYEYLLPPPVELARPNPVPVHRPNPVPVHRHNPVPVHRHNAVPIHQPNPAPVHQPNPAPVHRPNPAPVHRPNPMPVRPNPVPVRRINPVPVHRPNPAPVHRPNPMQVIRQNRNDEEARRNRQVRRMEPFEHIDADVRRLTADLRREGEQREANINPGQQLHREDAGLVYHADFARGFPAVPPPVDAPAAPNRHFYFGRNVLCNRHPYQPNRN